MTESEVRDALRGLVKYGVNQSSLAKQAGVSPAFFSDVLAGRKKPTDKILGLIGVERRTVYFKTEATR